VEQADSTSSPTLLSNVPVGLKNGDVPPTRVKVNDTSIALSAQKLETGAGQKRGRECNEAVGGNTT
jgi:hypothetical protein